MSTTQGGPLGGTSILRVNGSFVQGKKPTTGMEGENYSDYNTLVGSEQYLPGWMKLNSVKYCVDP